MKKNQLYPTDLTDCQWDGIKDLIPAAKPGGRPRTLEMRALGNRDFVPCHEWMSMAHAAAGVSGVAECLHLLPAVA